jgi:hypothetical protein
MEKVMFKLLLALLVTINLTTAFANPTDDQQVIRQLMKHQFDKPNSPLLVEHVVVDANYAIASWLQADTGGRALLKRDAKKWEIVLCAGEGLTQPAVLKQAGLDAPLASSLSKKITASELKSSAELRKKFSLFKGEVWSHQHHQAH